MRALEFAFWQGLSADESLCVKFLVAALRDLD